MNPCIFTIFTKPAGDILNTYPGHYQELME